MSAERKKLETQLDNLVRRIVVKRDKCCVICGSHTLLGVSHFVKRSPRAFRWDLLNLHLMCQKCHGEWERNENEKYYEWMVYTYGVHMPLDLHRGSKHPHKWTIEELKTMKVDLELQMERDYE